MERIRVDTDKLKEKSKEFETSAGVFSKAGTEIMTVAAGLPSYDGQLSTPARAAALEINRQSQDLHGSYMNISQSLARTAQAFEDVDNQTVEIFRENTALMSNAPIFGGPGGENDAPIRQGGSPDLFGFDFLAYKDYGDYVIFWRNGQTTTIIVTDKNRSLIQKYEDDLDKYFKNLADFLEIYRNLLLAGINLDKIIAVFILLVGADLLSAGLLGKIFGPSIAGLVTAGVEAGRDMSGLSTFDIVKECGVILDPINPTKYLDDLEKWVQYGQGASQALSDTESDWNALVPPLSPSGPTLVPAPTPSSPTPTETPPPPTP